MKCISWHSWSRQKYCRFLCQLHAQMLSLSFYPAVCLFNQADYNEVWGRIITFISTPWYNNAVQWFDYHWGWLPSWIHAKPSQQPALQIAIYDSNKERIIIFGSGLWVLYLSEKSIMSVGFGWKMVWKSWTGVGTAVTDNSSLDYASSQLTYSTPCSNIRNVPWRMQVTKYSISKARVSLIPRIIEKFRRFGGFLMSFMQWHHASDS